MKLRNNYNFRYGFTLVELIVVIVILLILGTIAVISLGSYNEEALETKVLSNVNNLNTNIQVANNQGINLFDIVGGDGTLTKYNSGTIGGIEVNDLGQNYLSDSINYNKLGINKNTFEQGDEKYYIGVTNANGLVFEVGSFIENTNDENIKIAKGSYFQRDAQNWITIDSCGSDYVQVEKGANIFKNGNITNLGVIKNVNGNTINFESNISGCTEGNLLTLTSEDLASLLNFEDLATQNPIAGSCSTNTTNSITDAFIATPLGTCTVSGGPNDGATGNDIFAGGDGSENNPFIIEYDYQLEALSCYGTVDNTHYFELANSISLENYKPNESKGGTTGWEPIMSTQGTFGLNGKGCSITNLEINNTNNGNYGLFGVIDNNFEISDLNIKSSGITGGGSTGILAGGLYGPSSIENIEIELNGNILSTTNLAGGLLGDYNNTSSNINNVSLNINGNIQGDLSTGGFIGQSFGNNITNSSLNMTGNITGTDYIGGFIGHNQGNNFINNELSITGDINGNGYIGGFIGMNINQEIESAQSYVNGSINGNNYLGGLIGFNSEGSITNSQSELTGDINGNAESIGGFVGQISSGNIENSNSLIGGNITGGSTTGGFIGLHADNLGNVNNSNSIVNGNIIGTGDSIGGFIGQSQANLISNSSSEINNITAGSYIGGFVGQTSNGNIENSSSIFNQIDGVNYIGGFIGMPLNSNGINQSHAIGNNINGNNDVGGFVGNNNDLLTQSFAVINNSVTGASNVGGFVGFNGGEINNSYNKTQTVTGTSYIGGFNGTSGAQISNVYSSTNNVNCVSTCNNGAFTGGSHGNLYNGFVNNLAGISSLNYFSEYRGNTISGNWNGTSWQIDSDTDTDANTYGKQDLTDLSFISNSGFDNSIWGHDSGINDGIPYLINNQQ